MPRNRVEAVVEMSPISLLKEKLKLERNNTKHHPQWKHGFEATRAENQEGLSNEVAATN